MNPENEKKIRIIESVIPTLDRAVNLFCNKLDRSKWISGRGNIVPRFKAPTSLHFQVLMAVRVVSALNASCCLLREGYTQETGVILRTIEEFLAKIVFIQEMHVKGEYTADQKRLMDEYFKHDIRALEDIYDSKNWWVDMNKVYASIARFLCDGTKNADIYNLKRNGKAIYDAYSGYVHGSYSQIMEMYEGGTECFRMNGMSDTPRVEEMLKSGGLATYTHRSLNIFAHIAEGMRLLDLRKELIEKRKEFEKSEAY